MQAATTGKADGDSFAGKTVMVTGAAGGIGLATAELLAARGASVAMVDLDQDQADSQASRLRNEGLTAEGRGADLTDQRQVRELVDGIVERHGQLDGLVNVAALYEPCPIADMTTDFWYRILLSSLDTTFFCCQAALRHMTAAGYGRIVNLSSGVVMKGGANWSAYTAAKAGVIGFTRSLAREAGPSGVHANVVMPGFIGTERALSAVDDATVDAIVSMQSVPRLGQPLDVAKAVAFLLSEEADFINGDTIDLGGGG